MSVFYTEIDLQTNNLVNFGLAEYANPASLPVAGTTGEQVFVTSEAAIYYWDGAAWMEEGGGGITSITGTAPIQVSGANDISIDPAVGGTSAGSISATDQLKLDNSTNTPTAGALAEYDAGGRLATATPVDPTDAVNLAYLESAIADLGQLVGTFDPSVGLPTTGSGLAGAVEAGDMWVSTGTGDIVGLTPEETVTVGDLLIATVDGASVAADFKAFERNLDLSANLTDEFSESRTWASSGVTETFTHNLNNANPVVEIWRDSDNRRVNGRVTATGINTVDVRMTGGGFPRDFTVTIHG